jgi:UDP-N-acetylglucosamine 2-epimerase (non-hydrolysing)
MKLLIIIGTRPNFIKVTQFKKVAASMNDMHVEIVHTGQHYDQKMSGVFFDQFNLQPDYMLSLRGDTPVEQFGNMITDLGALMGEVNPDAVIVPGDVNSTLAGALAANRREIPLYHLESGLRSFDRNMPEEINRILVDQITDLFFVTEASGMKHLKAEGLDVKNDKECAHLVGNTMIDTLVAYDDEIAASPILSELGLINEAFILITMHRPSNVDVREGIFFISQLLQAVAANNKVVFPIHPRTRKQCESFDFWKLLSDNDQIIMTDPLDYFAFQKLIAHAEAVITDSGGIQEETTFRQVPCITLRPNTERPITVEVGTNHLITEWDVEQVLLALKNPKKGSIPPMWDGRATERIMELIVNF